MLSLLRKSNRRLLAYKRGRPQQAEEPGFFGDTRALTDSERASLERATRELHVGFEELLKSRPLN